MSSNSGSGGGGIGFCGLLAILFIALKLTGHVQWSWLWVLAPIWIPVSLALSFLGCVFLFAAIASWSKS
jgi:hypothetical protein